MIRKEDGERIMHQSMLERSRRASKKMNMWISDILRNAARRPMEAGSSMEGPPRMDTPPWKGTHGDV